MIMTRSIVLLLSTVLLVLAGCERQPPVTEQPTAEVAPLPAYRIADNEAPVGRLPGIATPSAYRLALTLDPRQSDFSGRVEIDITLAQNTDVIWLHGKDLRVTASSLALADGAVLDAQYEQLLDSGVAAVTLGQVIPAQEVTLTLEYGADFDLNLAGLFKVVEQGESYALAKSESIQARRYLPGFDEPGLKATYDLVLTVPSGYQVITNAPEVSREPGDQGMDVVTLAQTRPMPTYLLSLAVGPFDMVERPPLPANEFRKQPIPLRGFARKGRGGDMNYVLDITPGMVEVFERELERPYPFAKLDIVAAPQWPSGATELSAAITYREQRILVGDEPAPGARLALINVHAHEIAHMWFGNLVTPPWWDDLWLKEGFATWGTPLALTIMEPDGGHDVSAAASAIAAMRLDSLASTRAIREPINSNENVRNAYDAITYRKSLGVIHMVDSYFGAEVFRPALGRYIAAFADGQADSPQFYEVIGEQTATPALTETFRSFVEQKGVPLLTVSSRCAEDKLQLEVQQDRYRPLGSPIAEQAVRWTIPLCLRTSAGQRHCEILARPQVTLEIPVTECPDWVLPNADGAGYYRWQLEQSQWEALLADFDQLTPIEALSLVDSALASFEGGQLAPAFFWKVVEASSRSSQRQVVTAPLQRIQAYTRDYLPAANRAALSDYLGRVYAPVLSAAEASGGAESDLLASELKGFLATVAMQPQIRQILAGQAVAFTGFRQPRDKSALSSDLYQAALTVALQDLPAEFMEHALAVRTEIDDPKFGNALATALGYLERDAAIREVQSLVLAGNAFGSREVFDLVSAATNNAQSRAVYWPWIVDNFPALVGKIPSQWRRSTPRFARHFCSQAGIDEVSGLFANSGDLTPGYQRALDQTIEEMQLCIALAERGQSLFESLP